MQCSHTRDISGCRQYFTVESMKDLRSSSHISARTTDGNYFKNFFQSLQKQRQDEKGQKYIKTLVRLHANA